MSFFTSAVSMLQTLVVALGAGLAVWGIINFLGGHGSGNPGANVERRKHAIKSNRTAMFMRRYLHGNGAYCLLQQPLFSQSYQKQDGRRRTARNRQIRR